MTDDGGGQPPPETVFSALGNETRLEILFTLHDRASGWSRSDDAVPYSELQSAVGEDDSGKFNYHLSRLTDHFVEKRPGGYAIQYAGKNLVRAALASYGVEESSFGPTEVDAACFRCGGDVVVEYNGERLMTRCADCPGAFDLDYTPDGTLSAVPVQPGGIADTDQNRLLERIHARFCHRARTYVDGACPRCGGEMDRDLVGCADHDGSDGPCPNCSTSMAAYFDCQCSVCGQSGLIPPVVGRSDRDPVAAALREAGVDGAGWPLFAEGMAWSDSYDPDANRVVYDPDAVDYRIGVDASATLAKL
ncbi:winged helix-turn-helix domain-containing protein [Halobaculum sp. P14]|uniref:winged helix-turn-helix domain-containing protein n=1 Tax=Halobaculum sp. P14 TaxID=3421638 RepID=UPI003EB75B1A